MNLLVQYHESWPRQFEKAAEEIEIPLGESLVAMHHVGSTAIDTVRWSKPVLDLIVEVRELADVGGSLARPNEAPTVS